jgi:hypothetical protein
MKKSMAALSCSVLVVLASCGSDSSTSGTDAPSLPTATTSTAAPVPTSSDPVATIAAASTVPTTDATTPPTESTEPEPTDPPTTESAPGTAPSTDSTGDAGTSEYQPVASPTLPAATQPVTAGNVHPDGIYYASISEGGDPPPADGSVVFEVVQLFTGQECVDHFGDDDEDACVNDYGVETDPTSYVEVPLDGLFISVVDAATQQSYRISGDELGELLVGGDPSPGAPADYVYSGFGYLLTYQGGEVTRVEQWWTP